MELVRDLAKSLSELDRAAKKYGDEELAELARRIEEQLGALINVFGRISAIYEELEYVVKGILRLDVPVLPAVEIKDGEDLKSFLERASQAGVDPNRLLAYTLAVGAAKIAVEGDRVVVRAKYLKPA
ncbi:MAG: hypothetical protein TU35_004980 [Thermoproteus sp. AZ2]|jgi:hypothetical protein|uniref:Uncharacterized protein n=1 Tax=Thermoproteus sp. AZ2 TaxID=1609232 RepID=A0ACC6V0J8_9CREN|nr:MAG: hypothetical protein TU35_04200 [Thermoproteus sp. AZ2]